MDKWLLVSCSVALLFQAWACTAENECDRVDPVNASKYRCNCFQGREGTYDVVVDPTSPFCVLTTEEDAKKACKAETDDCACTTCAQGAAEMKLDCTDYNWTCGCTTSEIFEISFNECDRDKVTPKDEATLACSVPTGLPCKCGNCTRITANTEGH